MTALRTFGTSGGSPPRRRLGASHAEAGRRGGLRRAQTTSKRHRQEFGRKSAAKRWLGHVKTGRRRGKTITAILADRPKPSVIIGTDFETIISEFLKTHPESASAGVRVMRDRVERVVNKTKIVVAPSARSRVERFLEVKALKDALRTQNYLRRRC